MIFSMYMVHIYICRGTQTHPTSMLTKWFDKCLTPRAVADLWGQTFVEPLGVYAGAHGMYPCVPLCICVCTNVYVVYTYGAHMIFSMYMVHIYICRGTQTHPTSMHPKGCRRPLGSSICQTTWCVCWCPWHVSVYVFVYMCVYKCICLSLIHI